MKRTEFYFLRMTFFVVIPTITITYHKKTYFDFEISWLLWFTGFAIYFETNKEIFRKKLNEMLNKDN